MLRAAPYVSLLLAALAALLPSCSLDPKEVGELTVPKLDLPGCSLASPFTLSIDFAGWNACHDMFFLRLQDGGEYATRSDGLDLQLYQLEALQDQLAWGPVTLPFAPDQARLSLYLHDACPDLFIPMIAANGNLVIDALEPEKNGQVTLSASFDLVDSNTGSTLATGASLTLDVTLSSYAPHTWLPACP